MIDDGKLQDWFCREIFPLEQVLMRFLRRHWRPGEAEDLRQEIFVKVYEAAAGGLPTHPRAFLFATARNHIASQARRSQIVSFDLMADLEILGVADEEPTPDRSLLARDDVRRLLGVLDSLSPRLREVVRLRKVEGLTGRETAERLGVAVTTVDQQLARAIRQIADRMSSSGVAGAESRLTARRLGR